MSQPLLLIAANGHNWITFEEYDTREWRLAIKWLKKEGYIESGASIVSLDEGILPSYIKQGVVIAAGFDNWSGNYLLAECNQGDQVISELAKHVSAKDLRSAA